MSKIQRQDIKTEADLAGAGAPASSLPGDDQVYVAANSINKTLRQAIIDGDIGGGAGGINYILNGSAQANTNGWATYADAAQSRPVDGTGGTPNVTWTRSTTTPLRGAGEFNFTKDAVNRQGQGVSYDFTIDRADQAKPLQIQFDWKLISGTFVGSTAPAIDSDIIVYILDVTNNRLIEPAGRLLEPALIGQFYRYRSTFQSSPNSTSYRLIFHVATTSAAAYVLGFDDVRVGPQVVSNGAVITDWQSFTPTGGFTVNTTYTGRFRRVGDSVELQYKLSFTGAPNASNILLNLPSGMAIDTTKLPTAAFVDVVFGDVTLFDSSASAYYQGSAKYNNSTQLLCTVQASATGQLTAMNQTAPVALASGDTVSINAKVPVVGFSSNVQLSSDTDTRIVSSVAFQTAGQNIANNTDVALTGLNIGSDTHGAWVGNEYRVPVTGFYRISVRGFFGTLAGGSTASHQLRLYIDGVFSDALAVTDAISTQVQGSATYVAGSYEPFLRAGQVVTLRAFQNAGNTRTFQLNNAFITRTSGPSQIAASEVISGFATNASGQVIPNSTDQTVTGWTKVSDTHNAFDATTGILTIPRAGFIDLQALLTYGGPNATGSRTMHFFHNNTTFISISTNYGSSIGRTGMQSRVVGFPVNAGDTIRVRTFQDTGAGLGLFNSASYNNFGWRIY
jgi:hypothetical protein